MRMWMVNPKYLCRQHLLGEHNEIHKHRHIFEKQYSITKRIKQEQIEPMSMKIRHDQLADEMIKRGYNHKSEYELPDLNHLSEEEKNCKVNVYESIYDLAQRCSHCAKLIKEGI